MVIFRLRSPICTVNRYMHGKILPWKLWPWVCYFAAQHSMMDGEGLRPRRPPTMLKTIHICLKCRGRKVTKRRRQQQLILKDMYNSNNRSNKSNAKNNRKMTRRLRLNQSLRNARIFRRHLVIRRRWRWRKWVNENMNKEIQNSGSFPSSSSSSSYH